MKYLEKALKDIFTILETKQRFTKGDKFLIKTVLCDLYNENKKLKGEKSEKNN